MTSIFLANIHHAYAQTDGTYKFPNSREGDMLATAMREILQLRRNRIERYNDGLDTAISIVKESMDGEYNETLICALEESKIKYHEHT